MIFILRHHLTGCALTDLLALINLLVPNLVPPSKFLFEKCFGNSSLTYTTNHYCLDCQNYIEVEHTCCSNCGKPFDEQASLRNGSFFLTISLRELLFDTLNNHGVDLESKARHSGNISDIKDGKLYQNLVKDGSLQDDDLTLTWNCDGVPIFNSSNYSIWPLQCTINELPLAQRKENVMVSAIWFGPKKPRFDTFLKPFIDQCKEFLTNPLQWVDSTSITRFSRVFSLVCTSDAVVRAALRNCKQFIGEYGCDWCLHPGEVIEKGRGFVRTYGYDEHAQSKRTHEQFKSDAKDAFLAKSPKHGVKGPSILFLLPKFDIVEGFVPDYMHCVLLGVCRQMVNLWLDSNNHSKPWYIGPKTKTLDNRLLSIRPPSELTRTPRSLEQRKFWKASEWRAFLLFYSIYTLPGILPSPFLEHFFLLTSSIHCLLRQSLNICVIQSCKSSLILFVKKMEIMYGKENVSYNVHQLIHILDSVTNWGPLWGTSAFTFEGNNGYLKSLFNGTQCVPQQVCRVFLLWRDIPKRLKELDFHPWSHFGAFVSNVMGTSFRCNTEVKPLGKQLPLNLTPSMVLAIEDLLKTPVVNRSAVSYPRFIYQNAIYHTSSYQRQLKRDNTHVKIRGTYAQLKDFLLCKINCECSSNCTCTKTPIVIAHTFIERPHVRLGNLVQQRIAAKVQICRQSKAFFLYELQCKCVYIDDWVVPLPNSFETD